MGSREAAASFLLSLELGIFLRRSRLIAEPSLASVIFRYIVTMVISNRLSLDKLNIKASSTYVYVIQLHHLVALQIETASCRRFMEREGLFSPASAR
jgi:hypothetical protein